MPRAKLDSSFKSMIPKSGNRFSDKIMLKKKVGCGLNRKMHYGT